MKLSPLFLRIALVSLCAWVRPLQAADPAPAKHGYTVTVEFHVDETGHPEEVSVLSSDDASTGKVIEKMALAMALKTQLPPKVKDGKPVKFKARAPFFFPIDDDEGAAANNGPKPKIHQVIQPVYPPALRESGEVGGVIFELIVDAEGKLAKLTTLRASNPLFDEAATDAVKKWEFTAAQQDGKPVESRTRLAIVFETEAKMADLKWRVAPRPSLGSFMVIRPDHPIQEDGTPAADAATPPTPAPATEPAPKP